MGGRRSYFKHKASATGMGLVRTGPLAAWTPPQPPCSGSAERRKKALSVCDSRARGAFWQPLWRYLLAQDGVPRDPLFGGGNRRHDARRIGAEPHNPPRLPRVAALPRVMSGPTRSLVAKFKVPKPLAYCSPCPLQSPGRRLLTRRRFPGLPSTMSACLQRHLNLDQRGAQGPPA